MQLPDDIFRRIKTDVMYPRFLELLTQALENAYDRGALYYPISGLRTWDEQAKLYAQGRTAPGPIVTRAGPGQSWHNFAAATDNCRDADAEKSGLQMDWNLADYAILAEEATKVGLEAAYNWTSFKEGPHVQLPCEKHGLTLEKMRETYKEGGMDAVFALYDTIAW
ncbi:Peptidase M15B [uncultured Caudovirales phage]|uniref:Peptidase M15B n=1 Tax=uncultured Caudovirales phage TaxID=2100421 RepID=A0A6J5L297_9CAUD|nr:Peptidase M15B [uncultured Caudovirales phage]